MELLISNPINVNLLCNTPYGICIFATFTMHKRQGNLEVVGPTDYYLHYIPLSDITAM